jgi:hypothetical protein
LLTASEEQNTWFHVFYIRNAWQTEKLVECPSSRC